MTVEKKGFNGRLNVGWFGGKPSASDVPWAYPVGIAGRGYLLNTSMKDQHTHASIPPLEKYLTGPSGGQIGENALNPDVSWRRSASSWHKGAGQAHLDLPDSDPDRFNASKGIDCWTRGALSLLPDVTTSRTSTNTNLALCLAGDYLYLADGDVLVFTDDPSGSDPTWTDSGLSDTVSAVCCDGHTVYVALSDGVYTTTAGDDSASWTDAWNDLVPDHLAYVKGRLMAAVDNSLYNITAGKLSTPTGLTLTTGGTAGTSTYGYRVSAVNSAGETLACAEVTIDTGNATLSATDYVKLAWDAVSGATSYNVYGRTSSAEHLMDTVSTTSFIDDGSKTPSGDLPAADTTTTAPTSLYDHPNTDWAWVGFATGQACLYAAGSSGHYSAVYRVPIASDGSSLDTPVQCAELPEGETCLAILGYLGLVWLGTSEGLRMCVPDSDGNLAVGPVIDLSPVRALCGSDRFVWFGCEDYDTTSTGLARADVTVINGDAPAYATDLMATAQGEVLSVVSSSGQRVFAVSGKGVYCQSADLVTSGTLDSGSITYDLPDPKIAVNIDVKHTTPLVGSHSVSLSADGGDFTLLGKHTSASAEGSFDARNTKAEVFEVRMGIGRDSTTTSEGPTLHRWTMEALQASQGAEYITVPILLVDSEQRPNGLRVPRDVAAELARLKGLRLEPRVFTYQEGQVSLRVTMADYEWLPDRLTEDGTAYQGTFLAKLLSRG